ncbi:hypothetical protein V8G54_027577 [Vigna mungo]|uniref:VQ domain-containing protein n=1 Tax=Vigna mungo TaxID=3915 RepID=A0AAQ3N1P2_VIGMU
MGVRVESDRLCLCHRENTMNFAASFCRRMNVKELVTNIPVYRSTSDVSGEGLSMVFRRWATKKTAGSTKNGRDSKPKNLGVKKFGGERVIPGNIIVRQRGTRFHPGNYVGLGKDHTLFALKEGLVKFERNKLTGRKWVHVEPKEGHVLHPLYANASASEVQLTLLLIMLGVDNKHGVMMKRKGKSKRGEKKDVKVTYISSPMKVKTSASNFRALVQELTGQFSNVAEMFVEADYSYNYDHAVLHDATLKGTNIQQWSETYSHESNSWFNHSTSFMEPLNGQLQFEFFDFDMI